MLRKLSLVAVARFRSARPHWRRPPPPRGAGMVGMAVGMVAGVVPASSSAARSITVMATAMADAMYGDWFPRPGARAGSW